MERLTVKQLDGTYHIYDNNVIRKASCCDENNKNCFSLYEGKAVDKLGAYEDAEEQGLLIRLPCKVGDVVYTKCSWGIEKGVVGSIEIIADRIFVNNIHGAMIGEIDNIFLTSEEAEAALERMNENA